MRKSQESRVLELLRRGPVTPLDALHEVGTLRLGARIFDLRQKGYNIRCDKRKGYGEYHLEEGSS